MRPEESDHEGPVADQNLEAAIRMLTPRAQRALKSAAEEAAERGMSWIGTEQILLALLRDRRGIAAQIIIKAGAASEIERRLDELLRSGKYLAETQTEDP